MNSKDEIFENPVNFREIFKGICYYIITFVLIVSLASIDGFTWVSVGVASIVSFGAFYLLIFENEVVKRPKLIEINDFGVGATNRLSRRQMEISWTDIVALNIPTSINDKKRPNSFLWLTKKKRWTLGNDIAVKIRDRYNLKVGKDPPKIGMSDLRNTE
jgi:hypothetical protein